MKYKTVYIYTILVTILYILMYIENRYSFIFPYGTLSGRSLVFIFAPVTILGFITVALAFRAALLSEIENRFTSFMALIVISTSWFFMSMYYMSHDRLNMNLSIANELRGKRYNKLLLSSTNGHFSLQKRGLHEIPPGIFQMADLKGLSLQGNQIDHIGPEIAASHLVELQIYSNNLSSLPNELSVTQIKYLSLGNNRLVSFPDDFRFPASLISLHLDNNQLISLSNSLANCTSLEHLNLWGNQLTTLPESLAELSQLKSLSLVKNKLTEFPPAILKLNKLTELGLAFNQIHTLPQELVNMTNLKSLYLGGNPIPIEQINYFREKMPFCNITFQN